MRLHLFAEGQTEQTFADTVLKQHLAPFGVYLNKPVLVAHARRGRQVHRGGWRKYGPMRDDVVRRLKEDAGSDARFTTMVDLYALPSDFPGRGEAEVLRSDPYARVDMLEKSWSEDIGDRRFIPFIQLHEYEAYLFVDVAKFGEFYSDRQGAIDSLASVADQHESPELIDDGQATAPSKRIIAEIPEYGGAKPTVGPMVAEAIGLHRIRAACPHFSEWLTKLEELGGGQQASNAPAIDEAQ